MGHNGVALGYPTPTCFRRLTGCQWDPRDRGVTPHKFQTSKDDLQYCFCKL